MQFLVLLFVSVSAFAHSPGDVITLAQDYQGSSMCKYEKGGTLTVESVQADRYSSSFKVKYKSPLMFAFGCWNDSNEMTWEALHSYYLDAHPFEKAESMERARLAKEAEDKKWADRSARKIDVGVGDRISIDNEAKSDNWGRSGGESVAMAEGGNCTFKAVDLFITKVSADSVDAVITKNEYRDFGNGCRVDVPIKLTRAQLNRWYERTVLARNLKLDGKCYEQKTADKTVEQCEEQYAANGPRFALLRKYCPEWNKIYGWENLDRAPADKVAADYPGISMAAYKAGINLNDVRFCPGGVPDAGTVRAACLKQIQVKCPGVAAGSLNSKEESERIENMIHPEKQENFLRGIIKNQEEQYKEPKAPDTVNGTLD